MAGTIATGPDDDAVPPASPSRGYWANVLRRLMRDKVAVVCLITVYSCARSRKYVVFTAFLSVSSVRTTKKQHDAKVLQVKTCYNFLSRVWITLSIGLASVQLARSRVSWCHTRQSW